MVIHANRVERLRAAVIAIPDWAYPFYLYPCVPK